MSNIGKYISKENNNEILNEFLKFNDNENTLKALIVLSKEIKEEKNTNQVNKKKLNLLNQLVDFYNNYHRQMYSNTFLKMDLKIDKFVEDINNKTLIKKIYEIYNIIYEGVEHQKLENKNTIQLNKLIEFNNANVTTYQSVHDVYINKIFKKDYENIKMLNELLNKNNTRQNNTRQNNTRQNQRVQKQEQVQYLDGTHFLRNSENQEMQRKQKEAEAMKKVQQIRAKEEAEEMKRVQQIRAKEEARKEKAKEEAIYRFGKDKKLCQLFGSQYESKSLIGKCKNNKKKDVIIKLESVEKTRKCCLNENAELPSYLKKDVHKPNLYEIK